MRINSNKISIVGAGFVGSSTAFAIMMSGLASEIVIVDVNKAKAEGEAMDLAQGQSFVKPVSVRARDYKDTKDSNIVIITAGTAQKSGQTRLELIDKNYIIFKSIITEIVKYSSNSILLVVSNPVDILTYITYKLSGFPENRIIGSGTVLDTSRLRYMVSDELDVDIRDVHSYVMGEHGDSEIAAWSLTSINGIPLEEYYRLIHKDFSKEYQEKILNCVRKAAYEVINRKGSTYYAIALSVKRIVEALFRDENSILTTSTLLNGEYGIKGVFMGVPCIIGSSGVKSILQIPLDENESKALENSAQILKKIIEHLNI
ncbi:L-lactate dehydrogenase [Clostridium sp. BJN0013]|uniref:L-lactate dehydrogenase n=1 Tax=Clostridium sp. BJN0013 TaxID=3236840 RepID=UPI0034C65E18